MMGLSGVVVPVLSQVLAELFVRGVFSRWRAGEGSSLHKSPVCGLLHSENKRRMSREHQLRRRETISQQDDKLEKTMASKVLPFGGPFLCWLWALCVAQQL